MSNYQILDIALNAAFFVTVSAIAVIFVLIRERAIRRHLLNVMGNSRSQQDARAVRAVSVPLPTGGDLVSGSPDASDSDRDVNSAHEPERKSPGVPKNRLSRAEKELISGIAQL